MLLFWVLLISRPFLFSSCSANFHSLTSDYPYEGLMVSEKLTGVESTSANSRSADYFDFNSDNESDLLLPSFVEERMTLRDLLNYFKAILKSKFNPLSIPIYLCEVEQDEFLNISMIMKGTLTMRKEEIFEELVGLWGYYLTLQSSPDIEARDSILKLILRHRYPEIIDGLLSICNSLNILSPNSKKTILINFLNDINYIWTLKLSSLKYLYSVTLDFIEEKFKMDGLVNFPYDYKFDVLVFDDLINKD